VLQLDDLPVYVVGNSTKVTVTHRKIFLLFSYFYFSHQSALHTVPVLSFRFDLFFCVILLYISGSGRIVVAATEVKI
jgi:hypothetical protein